jgi:D-glycero-D-manno-heptose 1,7-bisphosphate phosphatase
MAEEVSRVLQLDLTSSWVVGDKLCDVELALGVGANPILVLTGHGRRELIEHPMGLKGVPVVEDLTEAVAQILARTQEDGWVRRKRS